MSDTAMYKGRKYRLAWMGKTKYGQRAKLQFFDGSKEFWVPAEAVQVIDGERTTNNDARRMVRSGAARSWSEALDMAGGE